MWARANKWIIPCSWTKSATPHVTAYRVRWRGPEAEAAEEQTVMTDDAKGYEEDDAAK